MKHQWITVAALASAALFIAPATVATEDGTRLFKDWSYGQHIDDFPRSQGYYDCSGDLGVLALCNDNVKFLEYPFQGQLMFGDDNRLVHVSVDTEFSEDLYATIIDALVRSFALAYAEGAEDTFDVIEYDQQGTFSDERSLQVALTECEANQLRQGYFGMVMIEQEGLAGMPGATNVQDLLLDLPDDVRAADVYVYEDDWGPGLEASFYLPGRQRERLIEQAEQASVEDF